MMIPKEQVRSDIIVEEYAAEMRHGGCANQLIQTCTALGRVCIYICIYTPRTQNSIEVAVSPACARDNEKKAVFRSGRELIW